MDGKVLALTLTFVWLNLNILRKCSFHSDFSQVLLPWQNQRHIDIWSSQRWASLKYRKKEKNPPFGGRIFFYSHLIGIKEKEEERKGKLREDVYCAVKACQMHPNQLFKWNLSLKKKRARKQSAYFILLVPPFFLLSVVQVEIIWCIHSPSPNSNRRRHQSSLQLVTALRRPSKFS